MRGLWDKRGKVRYEVLWSKVNYVSMYVCVHTYPKIAKISSPAYTSLFDCSTARDASPRPSEVVQVLQTWVTKPKTSVPYVLLHRISRESTSADSSTSLTIL